MIELIPIKSIETNKNALPVALISLDDQVERRKKVATAGIPKEWTDDYFSGVDMRLTNYEELNQYADVKFIENTIERKVRPGEIGCSLSHKKASDWLADSEHPMLLVLEDDVAPIKPDFIEDISEIYKLFIDHAINNSAFVVLLGPPDSQTSHALKKKVVNKKYAGKINQGIYLFNDPDKTIWRAHAYIISREAARRAKAIEKNILTLADDWCLRKKIGLFDEIFFTQPRIITQDETNISCIRPPDHDDYYKPVEINGSLIARIFLSIKKKEFQDKIRSSMAFRTKIIKHKITSKFIYYV